MMMIRNDEFFVLEFQSLSCQLGLGKRNFIESILSLLYLFISLFVRNKKRRNQGNKKKTTENKEILGKYLAAVVVFFFEQ